MTRKVGRPPATSGELRHARLRLPKPIWKKIDADCKRQGITMTTRLWQVLMQKYNHYTPKKGD